MYDRLILHSNGIYFDTNVGLIVLFSCTVEEYMLDMIHVRYDTC